MFSLKRLELPSTSLSLTSGDRKSLRDLYAKHNFKSKSINKIILSLFHYDGGSSSSGSSNAEEDAEFEAVLGRHITLYLREGMPSLHQDISALLRVKSSSTAQSYVTDPYDVRRHPVMILARRLVDHFIDNLKNHKSFGEPTKGLHISDLILRSTIFSLFQFQMASQRCL